MVVSTTTNDAESLVNKRLCEYRSILLHLCSILFPAWKEVFTEANSLCCDDMLQWSTLVSWENCRVNEHRHRLYIALLGCQSPRIIKVFTHHDDTTTWSAQRLMCSSCNDMCVLHRVLQQSCSNQSGRVSHVNKQQCTNFISYSTHAFVVPLTAISRSATDNQFWFVLTCEAFHLVIVHTSCLTIQCITNVVIENT